MPFLETEQRVISLDHSMALPAAVVALGFALLARAMRAVSDGGALAGAGIAFLWMTAAGVRGIAAVAGCVCPDLAGHPLAQ